MEATEVQHSSSEECKQAGSQFKLNWGLIRWEEWNRAILSQGCETFIICDGEYN